MDTNTVILVIALSYVIGSFPTAYIAGRIKGINIFDYGSGNMGTTNVVRTLGTAWGAIVFVIDIAKGVLAVWVARQIAPAEPLSTQASASTISAVAVVAGHNWSVIASLISGKVRGGKGAATAGGTWLVVMPAIAIVIPVFIMGVFVIPTRYMSLAVMTAAAVGALIIAVMVFNNQMEPIYLLYTLVAVMIIGRHHENIKRLLAGKERRLGERVDISHK